MACAAGVLVVAATVAGCGGSSSSTTAASKPAAAPLTTATTPPPAIPRLRILSPRAGAHTGQTVTVHVVVTGSSQRDSSSFRYVVDGGRAKPGSARLTLRGLAPGSHHLVVTLANNHSVKGTRSFIVRTPPAPTAPVQSAPPTTQTQAPAPAPAPAPPQTTTSSPPPTTPSGGIPQNNGGDMDSDNNGGPSDGDGNI
jgi:hypothetical protein